MRRSDGGQSAVSEGATEHAQEVGKDDFAVGRWGDEGEHEVAGVGIDASSPTLALHDGDTVRAAVSLVHFRRCTLVPAVDDRRLYNPRKERRFFDTLYQVLFYRQIVR